MVHVQTINVLFMLIILVDDSISIVDSLDAARPIFFNVDICIGSDRGTPGSFLIRLIDKIVGKTT